MLADCCIISQPSPPTPSHTHRSARPNKNRRRQCLRTRPSPSLPHSQSLQQPQRQQQLLQYLGITIAVIQETKLSPLSDSQLKNFHSIIRPDRVTKSGIALRSLLQKDGGIKYKYTGSAIRTANNLGQIEHKQNNGYYNLRKVDVLQCPSHIF